MDDSYSTHTILLAFRRLRGFHTAKNLATVTQQALKEFNIQKHIHRITSNNATVNACMFIILERELDD